MENSIAEFTAHIRTYNHDKEEIERRHDGLMNCAAEVLSSLLGKTVEIKTKNHTYTGTVQEFYGWPRKEGVHLNPCSTGAVDIHFLAIYDVKEVQK